MASLRAVVVMAAALAAFSAGGAAGASKPAPTSGQGVHAYAIDDRAGVSTFEVRARAAGALRGGPVTTSTGEVVNVWVSDQLPDETPEKWAEFLVRLTHGPELARVRVFLGTLDEMQDRCGPDALGCYSGGPGSGSRVPGQIWTLGEPTAEAFATPEEVLRHEYGHHIAASRANPPWRALDTGPKYWASVAGVCSRVSHGEHVDYSQNPGEAWAEVYRLMDERKAGITTARWPIIASSYFPNEAALTAAERDVVAPWTGKKQTVLSSRAFGKVKKQVWWIPVTTPLDGELVLRAAMPAGGRHEVALVGPSRTNVLRKTKRIGQRVVGTTFTVCGQRSLYARVTARGPGRVTVTVSTP